MDVRQGHVIGNQPQMALSVACIPPHIWQQDSATWKAWCISRNIAYRTKEQYKRFIAQFLTSVNKSIKNVTQQDIDDYACLLIMDGKGTKAIQRCMRPIFAYWKFAKEQTV